VENQFLNIYRVSFFRDQFCYSSSKMTISASRRSGLHLDHLDVEYGNTLEVITATGRRDHEVAMSAYVIVEATVFDAESRNRYASQAEPLFREFGAEVIAFGLWQVLSGEPACDNGMIIRFPDNETALAWYQSPAYQSLLEIRAAALDCRFRLVSERRRPEDSHERIPLEGS
jgi:uncharacterized protein (DUF1330 family)